MQYVIKKMKETGHLEDKTSGRPKKTTVYRLALVMLTKASSKIISERIAIKKRSREKRLNYKGQFIPELD